MGPQINDSASNFSATYSVGMLGRLKKKHLKPPFRSATDYFLVFKIRMRSLSYCGSLPYKYSHRWVHFRKNKRNIWKLRLPAHPWERFGLYFLWPPLRHTTWSRRHFGELSIDLVHRSRQRHFAFFSLSNALSPWVPFATLVKAPQVGRSNYSAVWEAQEVFFSPEPPTVSIPRP